MWPYRYVVHGRLRELILDFSELFSYVVSTKEKLSHYFYEFAVLVSLHCIFWVSFFGTLFSVNSTRKELLQLSFRKEKKNTGRPEQ